MSTASVFQARPRNAPPHLLTEYSVQALANPRGKTKTKQGSGCQCIRLSTALDRQGSTLYPLFVCPWRLDKGRESIILA